MYKTSLRSVFLLFLTFFFPYLLICNLAIAGPNDDFVRIKKILTKKSVYDLKSILDLPEIETPEIETPEIETPQVETIDGLPPDLFTSVLNFRKSWSYYMDSVRTKVLGTEPEKETKSNDLIDTEINDLLVKTRTLIKLIRNKKDDEKYSRYLDREIFLDNFGVSKKMLCTIEYYLSQENGVFLPYVSSFYSSKISKKEESLEDEKGIFFNIEKLALAGSKGYVALDVSPAHDAHQASEQAVRFNAYESMKKSEDCDKIIDTKKKKKNFSFIQAVYPFMI